MTDKYFPNEEEKKEAKRREFDHKARFIRASELTDERLERDKDQTSMSARWLQTSSPSRGYAGVLKLKDQLMDEYDDASLKEVFSGETISNDLGECYKIESLHDQRIDKIDSDKYVTGLSSNLQLVCGIGPVHESQLKEKGYLTVEDLMTHPRWSERAKRFLELLHDEDVRHLQNWMCRFIPRTHPQIYRSSAFFEEEDFLILDIETMGLFGRVIILLGLCRQCEEGVKITQYLLKDVSNEPSALLEASSAIRDGSALITYNGKAFDVPYIEDRLAFYGLNPPDEKIHYDLLHYSRRLWRGELPDCTLDSMERYLGVERNMDLPSSLVPLFYETYLNTGNPGPLVPIIEHNKQDLLTLVTLFSRIHEEWS